MAQLSANPYYCSAVANAHPACAVRQRLRHLLQVLPCGLSALAALACAAGAAAQTSPYTTVNVVFDSGIIENTLPFDVPFLMTGTIGTTVTDVTIHYGRLPRNLARAEGDVAATCDGVSDWRTAGAWRRAMAGTEQFTILMPRLDVNEFYCFRFNLSRGMTAAEQEAFEAAAREAIDTAFRAVPRRSLTETEIVELRLELVRRLERLAGPGVTVLRRGGSVWDPALDTDPAAAFDAFLPFLQPILNAQQQIDPLLRNYRRSGTAAQSIIEAWGTDTDVRAIASALINAPADSAAVIALVTPNRAVLTGISTGLFEPGIDLTIDQPWFPTELDAALASAEAAVQRVEELEDVYAQLGETRALREAVNIEEDRLVRARAEVRSARNNLRLTLNALREARRAITARQAAIARAVDDIGESVRQNVDLIGTTHGAFTTRHQWYIGLDMGLATAPQIDSVSPYLGTNVYLRPVNKEAPLSSFGSFWQSFTDLQAFLRRFAVMVGLTNSGRFDRPNEREALFGNNALLTGAGYRVTDSFRFSGGFIVLRGFDPNPNVDRKRLQLTPFFSVSIDWDVRGTFTNPRP